MDGRRDFAVVETEDVAFIARDMGIVSASFDMSVYLVMDSQESVRIDGQAVGSGPS